MPRIVLHYAPSWLTHTKWTQQRLAATGLTEDDRCQACLAFALQLETNEVAKGTLAHRIGECPITARTHDATFAEASGVRAALARS